MHYLLCQKVIKVNYQHFILMQKILAFITTIAILVALQTIQVKIFVITNTFAPNI